MKKKETVTLHLKQIGKKIIKKPWKNSLICQPDNTTIEKIIILIFGPYNFDFFFPISLVINDSGQVNQNTQTWLSFPSVSFNWKNIYLHI